MRIQNQIPSRVSDQLLELSQQFPIQVKVMTRDETKQYHLKKLYELSIKSIGEIPQVNEPNEEQKQFLKRKGIK